MWLSSASLSSSDTLSFLSKGLAFLRGLFYFCSVSALRTLICSLLLFAAIPLAANEAAATDSLPPDTIAAAVVEAPPAETRKGLFKRVRENKKLVAAALAFPLPFGFFGAHRIYMGTKPYVPFVYIGTLGGCVLILPFIDFVTILLADEETFKRFQDNPKVFMWNN